MKLLRFLAAITITMTGEYLVFFGLVYPGLLFHLHVNVLHNLDVLVYCAYGIGGFFVIAAGIYTMILFFGSEPTEPNKNEN